MFYGDQVPGAGFGMGAQPPKKAPTNRLPRGQRTQAAKAGGGFTKKLNQNKQLYLTQTGVISYPNGQYCVSSGNQSLLSGRVIFD